MGQVVEISGGFLRTADASQLEEALNSLAADKDVVLSVNSAGGAGFPFMKFDEIIAAHTNPKRKIITHVGAGAECSSHCLSLYMRGQVRTAAPNSRFGFHAGTRFNSRQEFRLEAIQTIADWGVNRGWAESIAGRGILDTSAMTYLAPGELNGSGIDEHVVNDERYSN